MIVVDIIFIILVVIISSIGVIFISTHREEYGMDKNYVFIIVGFVILGGIFFILFTISKYTVWGGILALILWKLSISFGILAIGLLSFIHNYALELQKKNLFLPSFLYTFLSGITISIIFLPGTFEINQIDNEYEFISKSIPLKIISLLLTLTLIISIWYIRIKNNPDILDNDLRNFLTLIELISTISFILFTIYISTSLLIFHNVIQVIYLCGAGLVIFSISKKTRLFVILTNRIFRIIIFHQSGILLFSYNFEENKEEDDSILKGMILIGINHILANLIDKKEQINLIKMKNRDILLEFNSEFGFAVLLTTNQKTPSIEVAFSKFMTEFSDRNRKYFSELNGKITLIDTSQFKNARELIFEYFEPFIINV